MALILIVDDRPENRDVMAAILAYRGHDVMEAGDGAAALTLVDSREPDLVISDILMPSMDGFGFVRRLRERPSTAHIPVIFSSAHYLTAEAMALAATCGVSHILPKPVEPEDLIRLTDEVLAGPHGDGEGAVPVPTAASPPRAAAEPFGEAHLRLLTDQLAEHNRALALANERLEAEVTVRRQAESRYRAVVDTAADAIVVSDEGGTIQSFNKAAETIFGYLGSEVIGKNVAMLRHRTTGLSPEIQGRRKDGSTFDLELAVAEWTDGGRRYFTGIMRDITQRREVETALKAAKDQAVRARAEAERADLAKTKFLAAVSHDLRQPAQAMVLFAPLVVQALRGHPQEAAARHLEHALFGLTKMLDVLLDVSKLDAGCIVPQLEPVALDEVVRPLVEEYALRASRQGLRLRMVPTSARTVSDPTLLERIVRNLIENALSYTQAGAILIGCRRRGGRVRLDVVDTGIGIAEDKLDHIFDEFFQVGNPERDRTKGLGLGLAIVKRLSRLLDHPVEVASRPGRGTRISLLLPATATVGPSRAAPPHVGDAHAADRAILVVEDEAMIRSGMACILANWGYRVLAAESGEEAAALVAAEGPPDAIIADYRLRRGETGLDAIRRVMDHVGRAVPGLVLTGDTTPEIITTVQDAGFVLMHKPLTAATLHAAVTTLLPTA